MLKHAINVNKFLVAVQILLTNLL